MAAHCAYRLIGLYHIPRLLVDFGAARELGATARFTACHASHLAAAASARRVAIYDTPLRCDWLSVSLAGFPRRLDFHFCSRRNYSLARRALFHGDAQLPARKFAIIGQMHSTFRRHACYRAGLATARLTSSRRS